MLLLRLMFLDFLSMHSAVWCQLKEPDPLLRIQGHNRSVSVTNCCEPADISKKLQRDCVHQHATSLSGYTGMQSSIVLVSYTTESVLNFALPAYAINSAFAETHEHALRLFFPSDSEEFYHIDERWNKVKVAEIVLQENNVSAVMWIDADMIVFDFSFDVQQMLDRYSADLVISAERFTENGVVNTGCFIARNTDWTKRFLQLWWTVQDKASGMDQHVFDYIWRGNLLDVQQHVAILPHDILNTHFPATKNQKEHHQFLHLAGASSSYRQIVFEHGLAELCSSTRERRLMAHQLGLNRTFLLCVEMIVKEKLDLVRLQREIENHSTSVHDLEAVQKFSDLLRDVKQSGYRSDDVVESERMHSCRDYLPSLESEEEVDLLHSSTRTPLSKTVDLRIIEQAHRISFERLLLHHTRLLDCKRMNKDVDSSCKIITPQTVLDLLQLVYDAGFNYAVECTNLDKRIITLTKLLEILPQLLSLTSKQSKGQAYYYEYKIYELLGYAYSDSFRIAQVGGNSHERFIETLFLRANESLHAALESWEKLRVYKYYGSGAGVSDPYKEVSDVLVQLSAMHCYHYLQGSEDLAESDSYLLGYSYANRSITLVDAVWRSRDLNYDQFLAQVVGSTVDELFVSDQMELRVCDQRNKPLLQQKGESTYRKDEYLVTLPLGVVLSLASTHAHGLNCLLQNTRLDLSTVDELQQNALANSAAQHCSIVLWLSCHRSEDEESLYSLLLELLPAISSVTSSTDTNKRSQLWNLCNQIIEKLKRQDKPPNKQKVFRRKKIKYKEEL